MSGAFSTRYLQFRPERSKVSDNLQHQQFLFQRPKGQEGNSPSCSFISAARRCQTVQAFMAGTGMPTHRALKMLDRGTDLNNSR